MNDISAVFSEDAPRPIGPYSQAVRAGDYLYVSGMLPINPVTEKIAITDIEGQTKQVLENIVAVLKSAGAGIDQVIKTTIYLANIEAFPVVNRAYGEIFTGEVKPARETVQVARLPLDAKIEISCIAYLGK